MVRAMMAFAALSLGLVFVVFKGDIPVFGL
jgi:hypothetical protein